MANKGLKSYNKFIEGNIGSLVQYAINVNNNDANMHLTIPLIETVGLNPISVSLYYNHQYKNHNCEYGKGMWDSFSISLTDNESSINVNNVDGTSDYYYYDASDDKYKCSTSGNTITRMVESVNSDSDIIHHVMEDKYGNTMSFIDGTLSEISYVNDNTVNINGPVVTNNKGATITKSTSNGRIATIEYIQEGISVNKKVVFGYDTLQRLVSINYYQGISLTNTITFEYTDNEMIINDVDGNNHVRFTYNGYKIIKVEEKYTGDYKLVYELEYDNKHTKVIDRFGDYNVYVFDENSLCIFEYNNKRVVIEYEYDNHKNLTKKTIPINLPLLLSNNLLSIDDYCLELIESNNIQIVSSNVQSLLLAELGLTNVYNAYGDGSFKYRISCKGLALDNISFLMFGKYNNNYNSDEGTDVDVFVRTYKNDILMDEAEGNFSSIFEEEFDLLTLGLKTEHSYDEIEFEVKLNGDISLYFSDICIMKKDLGSLFSYDEHQNLTDIVSGSGKSFRKYNADNLLEEVIDSKGNIINCSYSDGNLDTIKSQHSTTCKNYYNDDKELTSQVIESETAYDSNSKTYDEYGNVIESKDALNNITKYSYDLINFNMLSKIEGINSILEFEYNINNRVKSRLLKDINDKSKKCRVSYSYVDDLVEKVFVDFVLKYRFVYTELKNLKEVYLGTTLIYKVDYNSDGEIEYISHVEQANKYRFVYENHKPKYIYYVTAYRETLKHEYVYENDRVAYVLSYEGNVTYKKEYTYNLDELIIGVLDSVNDVEESNITLGYDNLSEINEEIINVKNHEVIKTYDSISRSSGSHSSTVLTEYQNKDDMMCVDFNRSTNLVGKNIEIECINTKPSSVIIEPSISSGVIPCMNLSLYKTAAYKVDNIGSTFGSVAFWVKPSSISNDDILFFAAARNAISNAIKVYVDNNKLKVVYTDENDISYDILETSNTINNQKWNYFSMIWSGKNFYVMLNDEYVTGSCSINPTLVSSNLYYFIGHRATSLTVYNVLEGDYTGLIVARNKVFDISFIKKYYLETKEYIIDTEIVEDDIKYVNHIITNEYQIDSSIRDLFDIYPLSNSVKSLDGNIPVDFEPRTHNLDKDRTFNYNLEIKRYAYVADGNMLAYKFGNSSTATIAMRVYLEIRNSKQYLFHSTDRNGNSLGLLVDSTGSLKYQINNTLYSTGLSLNTKTWHFVSFSYKQNANEYSTFKDIRIYVDGNEVLHTINNNVIFSELTTVIGRLTNETTITTNGLTETTSYPLYGQIECLCERNAYSELQTINNLYSKLVVNTTLSHYNELGMLKKKDIMNDNNEIMSNSIYYNKVSNKENQLEIEKELIRLDGESLTERNYTYTKGNITLITDSVFGNKTYEYNYRGFLTNDNGTTITYDNNGNILTYGIKSFTYDSTIKDRLSTVNGQTITYSQSQPLYPATFGNKSYIFEGNRLVSITESIDNDYTIYHRYYYNHEGLRIKKVIEHEFNDDRDSYSTTTSYFYSGDRLITEYRSDNDRIDFLYDNNGLLYGFINNKTERYYYVRDILQNILGIVDSNGNLVVKYDCNAYGDNQTIIGNTTLGYRNPFRYKGYYYDNETNMYYCKSRYYNPEWCRWLTPDSIEYLDTENHNGLNLFAYCDNDPVNKYDPTGHFGFWALVAITVTSMLIGGTVQLVSNAMAGKTGSELWRGVAGAAVGTGVNALALCLAIPTGGASLFIAAGASAVAQTGVDTLETVIRGEEVDVGKTFIDLGLNFATTLAGNYFGGKLIPTNPGWFQPKKFLSIFTKPYGQKILLQTAIGAGLSGIVNFVRKNDWSKYKLIIPVPVVPLYPLF